MRNNCSVKLCFFDVLIDLCLLTTVLGGKNHIAFYHFILAEYVIIRDIVVIIVERANDCLVFSFLLFKYTKEFRELLPLAINLLFCHKILF